MTALSTSEILVRWDPPLYPNGNITHYLVYWLEEPEKSLDYVYQTNTCADKLSQGKRIRLWCFACLAAVRSRGCCVLYLFCLMLLLSLPGTETLLSRSVLKTLRCLKHWLRKQWWLVIDQKVGDAVLRPGRKFQEVK